MSPVLSVDGVFVVFKRTMLAGALSLSILAATATAAFAHSSGRWHVIDVDAGKYGMPGWTCRETHSPAGNVTVQFCWDS